MSGSIPKISVGLPVYNGERYLARSLRGLLAQDMQDFELIVSDNASTDRTGEICREFAASDPRVHYHRNETNIGATGNYNRVFQLARGEFFKWASHDDECHPSLLRRCWETFQQAPASAVLVYPRSEIIDENGEVTLMVPDSITCFSRRPVRRLGKVLFNSAYATPLWGLIRTAALRKTRGMGVLEADHVVLAELSMLGHLIEIPEVLYRMRRHERCATEINRSARELLAWHDPKRANERIFLPHWERVYIEYLKSVRHVKLPVVDRWLCYAAVPTVSYWRRLLRWTGPARLKVRSWIRGGNGSQKMAGQKTRDGEGQASA